jgi:hypothetical protein
MEAQAMYVNPCCAYRTTVMAVKTCSKALFALSVGHGKSPCFSDVVFLRLFGVAARVLKLACADGVKFVECAFCHGSK